MEKNLTKEEIESLNKLQDDYLSIQHEIGKIEIEILNLEQLKNEMYKTVREEIEKQSQTIAKQLHEKYGDGEINLDKGTISLEKD
jgi:predicted transcriptional regulator